MTEIVSDPVSTSIMDKTNKSHFRNIIRNKAKRKSVLLLSGLENELTLKSREFEDLKKKHEALEEDYVVIKSQLQCGERGDRSHLEDELKRLRETFTQRQDNWIKEKLEMQASILVRSAGRHGNWPLDHGQTTSKIRELEDHMQLNTGTRADVVRRRLQERVEHLERKLKEAEVIEQMYERLKEEYDDIRTRLRDYESYSSAQKILNTPHSDAFEREIRDLRARLSDSEKAHKAEIAHMKLKASSKEAQHNAELSTLRQEIVKAGRERDTLKNLLEGTQRHMSSLKATTADVNEEEKQLQECYATIAENEERIQSLEDQISEARMESVRTKTDLATQKAGWELRMAQLQTRINELEEEKILSSGRSRLSGLRSKLELAWQKEREDQQRLLKEITESNKELRDAMNQV
ncbi:unnamed protein product [Cyprideis torosa]|uniref:Uncharacterized protein n=1 Tax=Cyprideis torosa TaxID=163714 RepID=A0A7R8WPH7_9CRUS|nr:unnamed protein product [Cyprideis torosa]CAG0901816.1 unnamed protein product [Cyprideis torosa]